MALKDKATYGEHFWAMQVEAAELADENIESAFAPYFAGVLSDIPYLDELPASMQALIRSLSQPPSAGFGGFALGVGVEMIDETLHALLNPMMKMMARSINRRAKETWLTSDQANKLFREGKIEQALWKLTVESEGYEDVLGRFLYESQAPYPSIPDLVLYSRYHGDPENPWSKMQDLFDVPAKDWPVWKWLGLQRLNTQQAQILYKRGQLSDTAFFTELSRIGWSAGDRPYIEELGWTIPNAMLLVQGGLMAGVSDDKLKADISIADIHPKYAQTYIDAVLTKPSTADIIAYELRRDPKLARLPTELRKIGIHETYAPLLRELAYIIPPVGDIITMAVREAFTPDIAARFGQYEDFPAPFAEWAAKKGLTKEWAERYWASHWTLPSAQQGFEMLHRGAVNAGELNMLLRALDIMPFWREKLTKIAYRRVTRVDIRRMYKIGVLNESDVYEANLELGYNPRDAKRMTTFTVQWALPKEASITRSDILTAYKNRMIDRGTASQLLENMGEELFHRNFMLSAVDYKKGLELTAAKIKGIANLYRKRQYDSDKARDELSRLGLPDTEISDLMEQWWYEIKAEPPRLWTTAQTLSFIKDGLITQERGIVELQFIGYDAEHIDVYLRSLE